jgi:hypothetical protein
MSVISDLEILKREIERMKTQEKGIFVPLTTLLTSASWSGNLYSTTAKTLIDLSIVFGVPAGVKAVLVRGVILDSGSAAAGVNTTWMCLGPTNASGIGMHWRAASNPNNFYDDKQQIIPCDSNGDIYYQLNATGVNTMGVYLQIWGYWI